jgi:arsenical pump membrane protein
VLLVIGLFFVVQSFQVHGLPHLLARVAGTGESWPDHFRLAAAGALGANGVDNLPAYLALEPVADSSPARLVALLLGVNCGPLLTLWASLATLLWRERCRAAGVEVSARRFLLRGLVVVPLLLVTTTAALSLSS